MASGLKGMRKMILSRTPNLLDYLKEYWAEEFDQMNVEVLIQCKAHPRYAAKKEPTSECPMCWSVFLFTREKLYARRKDRG